MWTMWPVQSHSAKSTRAVDEGGGQGDGGSVTVLVSIRLDTMSRSWPGIVYIAASNREVPLHHSK